MRRGGRWCWLEGGAGAGRSFHRSSSAPLLLLLAWLLLVRKAETAAATGMQQRSGRLAAAAVARGWQRHRGGGVSFVPLAPLSWRQQHEQQQQQQRQQHRPPLAPPQNLDRPLSTTTARISSAATSTTAPKPSSAGPMEQPTARERANMAVASYFPLDTKDNATAFFHVSLTNTPPPPSWAHAVAAALGLPSERAQKLHEVGAVYARRGGKFRRTRTFAAGGVDEGRFPPPVPVEGELVRVHLFPRRFPRCYGTDYRQRIAYEDEDLLVVEKPAGCPCSLHVSNALEVLDIAASANLGLDLIRMNRLDTVTTGLVTLAKTPKGASLFWEELRRDRVGKRYRALVCDKPLPVGPLHHYMPGKIIHRRPAPRAVGRKPLEGWKECESRVISCSGPLQLPWIDPATPERVYYEVEAELITGRTHQLRATFAAEGAAIVHDSMYTPLSGFFLDDEDDPAIQELYPLCVEPSAVTGIGLQCSALTFLGRTVEAGEPWWRQQKGSSQ